MHIFENNKIKLKHAFLTIAIFVGIMALLYLPFVVQKNSLIWNYDGIKQHYVFLKYISENGLSALGSYDYFMGLGADYNISYSYYLLYDPFNILFLIFPSSFDVFVYGLLIFIKFVLTGLFMFIYLRNKSFSYYTKLAGSISYMLCGFATFSFIRHPCLISGCMYLPLLILGLEKVIRERKFSLFIFITFLSLITNFYMFFMSALFAGIYALFLSIDCSYDKNKKFRKHLLFNNMLMALVGIMLGVLLGAFSLFPTIIGYFDAPRSGSKGLLIYGFDYYFRLFATFISPLVGENYTPLNLNIMAIVLSVIFMMTKGHKRLKILLAIFTFGLFISIFGYTFNLFNYVNNRWVFILHFVDSIAISYALRYLEKENISLNKLKAVKITLIVCSLMAVASLIYGMTYYKVHILLLIVVTIILVIGEIWFLIWFTKFDFINNKWVRDNFTYHTCLSLLLFCFIFNSFCFYVGYSFEFLTKEEYNALLYSKEEDKLKELQNKHEFFRIDKQHLDTRIGAKNNKPVANRYYGTYGYNTISVDSTYDFLSTLGVYNATQNLGITGLNGRVVLNSILNCKYFISEYGYKPFNYRKVSEYGPRAYENPYYLNFGFTIDEIINKEDFLKLNLVERNAYLMKGIILEDEESTIDFANTSDVISYRLVNSSPFSSKLTIVSDSYSEVYLSFDKIKINNIAYNFMVSNNNMRYQISLFPKGHQMYYQNTDFILNFGSFAKTNIQLYNDNSQIVEFENLKVYEYPMEVFIDDYDKLKDNPYLENLTMDKNGFKGEIEVSKDTYEFFSIPYSRGWKAYVDGKEEEILKANIGFMALKLEAGKHQIEFKYTSPFFKEGVVISILDLGVILVLGGVRFIYGKVKGKDEEYQV